jgi:hypothetical protein
MVPPVDDFTMRVGLHGQITAGISVTVFKRLPSASQQFFPYIKPWEATDTLSLSVPSLILAKELGARFFAGVQHKVDARDFLSFLTPRSRVLRRPSPAESLHKHRSLVSPALLTGTWIHRRPLDQDASLSRRRCVRMREQHDGHVPTSTSDALCMQSHYSPPTDLGEEDTPALPPSPDEFQAEKGMHADQHFAFVGN